MRRKAIHWLLTAVIAGLPCFSGCGGGGSDGGGQETGPAVNAPSSLQASSISSTQIYLTWADNSADETGFRVERKTGAGGSYTLLATILPNLTSYTDTGLTASTTYHYRIQATSSSGSSGYSNESSATTSAVATRFIDRGNGTMYDTVSTLTWLKNANCFGTQKWDIAVSKAEKLASGQCGLTDGSSAGDWHLPTLAELRIFVDDGYRHTTLNAAGFIDVQSNYYWTSTTGADLPEYAWTVHMYTVYNVARFNKSYSNYYVWPVRSGT